ncbi:MAG: sigma 54-interacting transcriptional regulator [Planctomycetaceae bacterium]|jgi:Nif-specific regulatory protein|nr:sigma 54-interacting transcriptional regulator [Planctomycetaceae bacterium]
MQRAILTVNAERQKTREYSLSSASETTLGRSSKCTVFLEDERASRKHAAIYFQQGKWYVRDLKSRNGTIHGNQILKDDAPLEDGDRIWIGHCEIRFQLTDAVSDNSQTDANDTESDSPRDQVLGGTGMFGISEADGVVPSRSPFDPQAVTEWRTQTSFLNVGKGTTALRMTQAGYDSSHLCQLAFRLGKSASLNDTAQTVLEGLLQATGADVAALWLLPQEVKSAFRVSQLRLIASVKPESQKYLHISEALAKTVIENREAILMNNGKDSSAKLTSDINEVSASAPNAVPVFNTLAAPIRFQDRVLGLIHLYNQLAGRIFTSEDLEYTLAVADTLGAVLTHLTREKELSAHLNETKQENTILRELLSKDTEIIGVSPAMRHVGHLIERVSEGKATLLVRGESGTGKELIARAVHFAGSRKAKPFVCLNCAAVSESLLASELFGHEKGAFTGATERKIGKFEAAHHGTLFLDEIGEMSPALQAKFLRVLEGHPFERVGGNTPVTVDVRVVAATNRDLEKEVTEGRFRHDLFFRLRVLEIVVSPLRKRKEDIMVLAYHFLERFRNETGRKVDGFSESAKQLLREYRWPGNVRELKNVIERAMLLGTESLIQESDVVLSSLRTTGDTNISSLSSLPPRNDWNVLISDPLQGAEETPEYHDDTKKYTPMTLEQWEKQHIEATLQFCEWNKSSAARILGIERTTLDRKIKRYELEKE